MIYTDHEKMQFLGLFGIYKESYKIMLSRKKIFTQITLTLILPLSFIILIHLQISDILFGKIMHDSQDLTSTPSDSPQQQKLINLVSSDWGIFFLFKFLYFIFAFIFSLLSTSAVVYTIASIYTSKEVTSKNVISVVPKVWKRLVVTFLCTLVAFFVYNVMAIVAVVILALTTGVKSGGGVAILFVIAILYVVGFVYLTVVWQLANVVTVLEDSYGFEGMAKSRELIKGKMGLSVVIVLKLKALFSLILTMFAMMVVNGWKVYKLSTMERTTWGVVCFVSLSCMFLLMLVVETVLYFVCKSYHNEIIDKSALSDRLEVYQKEQYEPLETKDVQLDYHV
ncbi:hypothetical protein RJT34_09668 [Clitoria ternatea]|uniref:Transmembrane protein n=1 Tax=Clitoria ternatea TaxID=43366 RepID=A0AAN9K570_CLITE